MSTHTTKRVTCTLRVPSHIGLKCNEKADNLAKSTISEGTEYEVRPVYSELLSYYKKTVRCYGKNTLTKDLERKLSGIEPFKASLHLYLLTGHIPCGKFAFLMKKKQSPNCVSCDMNQDVQQLLAECVLNEEERKEFIKKHGITRCSVVEYQLIIAQPLSEKAEAVRAMVLKLL